MIVVVVVVVVVVHNGLYLNRDFYASQTYYSDLTLTLACLLILPVYILIPPSRRHILYPSLCSPVTAHKASSLLTSPSCFHLGINIYQHFFLFPLRVCVCVRACKVNLFHEAESFFIFHVSPFVFTSSCVHFFRFRTFFKPVCLTSSSPSHIHLSHIFPLFLCLPIPLLSAAFFYSICLLHIKRLGNIEPSLSA